ncbi:uncharacterized protein SETTUDRAFT_154943 [Exserohilum turcica Et28A]|uniref:Uncharacterized protein n=1 Tax=Exserohilum turcicum (strain 28A) TaxID=671987 RepID=R0JWR1_EXST2|nr:uncharacterized protein SETTUDRAFT_154943 [Exserohilum turcica Et28A]EOA85388.1 hypothetical protein SETTUDRAFT_154943 [Exserohilum turcica Et28A]
MSRFAKRGRLKVLVLYGNSRKQFYSRLLAFEAIRILFRLGCDFRVYDSTGLPVKGIVQHLHPNVQESRDLSKWSDDPVWISCALVIAQVCGGFQSFNTVNSLRILGRWRYIFTTPIQSSSPMACTQFTDENVDKGGSRLMPSSNRDKLIDCRHEFVNYTVRLRPYSDFFGD